MADNIAGDQRVAYGLTRKRRNPETTKNFNTYGKDYWH
jgi:hypothetical protein